jgi:hypothetical protein
MSEQNLLDRIASAIEKTNNLSERLVEYTQELKASTKELNDQFVLHQIAANKTNDNVEFLVKRMVRWLQIVAGICLIALGGTWILEKIISFKIL